MADSRYTIYDKQAFEASLQIGIPKEIAMRSILMKRLNLPSNCEFRTPDNVKDSKDLILSLIRNDKTRQRLDVGNIELESTSSDGHHYWTHGINFRTEKANFVRRKMDNLASGRMWDVYIKFGPNYEQFFAGYGPEIQKRGIKESVSNNMGSMTSKNNDFTRVSWLIFNRADESGNYPLVVNDYEKLSVLLRHVMVSKLSDAEKNHYYYD